MYVLFLLSKTKQTLSGRHINLRASWMLTVAVVACGRLATVKEEALLLSSRRYVRVACRHLCGVDKKQAECLADGWDSLS